jgi:hypothetical protein
MINTKLILLDGMTGAGKSTAAQRLWLHLERQGNAARWFYEHDACHPIWQTDERVRMAEAGVLDPAFVEEVLLLRWRNLAHECCAMDNVTILDGTFFHSTVGHLLAMNVPDRVIIEHVRAVDAAIAETAPALVYFRQRDIAQALSATFRDRQADDYADILVQYVGQTPYGKKIGLSDPVGLVGFYEHWARLVDLLLRQLGIARLVVDRQVGDWGVHERQLTDFLGLPPIGDFAVRIEEPRRFIGRYRDTNSSDELVVAANERGLYLDDSRRTALIPVREGAFHIAATCAELSFSDERGGLFRALRLSGNLTSLSPMWVRTQDGSDASASGTARSLDGVKG